MALITGASAGIGTAFARRLADRGHDLVIVARRKDRLDDLAQEITKSSNREVEVLVADLESAKGVRVVEDRVVDADRPVDLLVNNAGFGTSGRFDQLPIEAEEAEINLNVIALVRLTHAALGAMVERGHGGVINVSSFTNAIHEELRGTGVKAMVLAPGFTHTEFHLRAGIDDQGQVPEFLWQSADEVVAAALRDYDRGKAVCIPGPINTAAAAFSGSLPAGITRRIAAMVTKRTY